jgi:hypothetical protein
MTQSHDLVDNIGVRRAVRAFAANPGQHTMIEVLRTALSGELLLDVTGSDLLVGDDRVEAGSALRIRTGIGPDGGRALLAFTRNDEIAKSYPEGTHFESLGTPATGVLQLAKDNRDAWLYLDPAGPTCALSASDIDLALRIPRNDPLKKALAHLEAGRIGRAAVLEILRADGPLLIAADGASAPTGTLDRPATVSLRATTLPNGSAALLAYTSGPEIAARDTSDAIVTRSTGEVLEMVRDNGYGGLLINPAGPWIAFSAAELGA